MHDRLITDTDLVLLAGEVDALGVLLERHRVGPYAAALAILGDRQAAMDAVQETFVVALTRLGSLRDPGAVGGWLQAVLRNCCLLQLRRGRHEVPNDQLDMPTSVLGPEEAMEQLALRSWIWTALEAIGEDERLTDVTVQDGSACWRGIRDWSTEERTAIDLGVRAQVIGLAATTDLTVLEIDFRNPSWAVGHCPPSTTFVHHLRGGRSASVDIYYHAS